jgi:hypothetical protein
MVKIVYLLILLVINSTCLSKGYEDHSVISFSKPFIQQNEFKIRNTKKIIFDFNYTNKISEYKYSLDSNFINILKDNYWQGFQNIVMDSSRFYSSKYYGTKMYSKGKIKYHFYIIEIGYKKYRSQSGKLLYIMRTKNDTITNIIFSSRTNFSDSGGGRYSIVKKNSVTIKFSSIPVLFRGWFVAYQSKDYIFTTKYKF